MVRILPGGIRLDIAAPMWRLSHPPEKNVSSSVGSIHPNRVQNCLKPPSSWNVKLSNYPLRSHSPLSWLQGWRNRRSTFCASATPSFRSGDGGDGSCCLARCHPHLAGVSPWPARFGCGSPSSPFWKRSGVLSVPTKHDRLCVFQMIVGWKDSFHPGKQGLLIQKISKSQSYFLLTFLTQWCWDPIETPVITSCTWSDSMTWLPGTMANGSGRIIMSDNICKYIGHIYIYRDRHNAIQDNTMQ